MSSNVVSTGPRIIIRRAQLDYPVVRDQSSIKSALFGMLGFKTGPKIDKKYVHAINGLSLTINRGERVGFVGHNGAGKSTLLRTIAGVYPLTSGSIEVTGRMQGLFDLGTGFESEASGRENIMYRGLSLGFTPREVREREEEIIAFADLGEFIDLPMRAYSAGMWVRLGFAVSTYLDGDILLIDEVFGAGDANFQDRAVKRMMEMIDRAGILVMVSHDLAMLSSLCTRLVWLAGGQMVLDGEPREVADAYLRSMRAA
jgi:lipopolysaccharide transport system ATP-binding protein